jgi:alkanesulfonate monooxygenase SsuD/methylene tetrahydromethanopterin reductase-like flavin-dependent oxidoreductase (luciferase family)
MKTSVFHLMPYQDITESKAWPFEQDTYDPEKGAGYYQDYLDQLEYAAELGFDALGVNEHHYSAYGLEPNPNITASALIDRTDDVTIAFYGNIPTIRGNPIRLAEEIAMLDNLSEGRVISGFPRGIPKEFFAYNIDIEEARPRFEEAWDLIMKAWTAEEPFDWDGQYFQYENVNLWPRPYQDPHPPLWMPAESEESLRFTAERKVPTGSTFQPAEKMREIFDEYRQYAEEDYGWTPTEDYFTVSRRVYVAETDEKAREEAEEHLEFFYKTLTGGDHIGTTVRMMGDDLYDPEKHDEYIENLHPHGELAYNFDFEEFQDIGEIIVGSPETVVEEIERQYETIGGFGELSGTFHFGDMPNWKVRKNLELYADEVKPEVDKLGNVNP